MRKIAILAAAATALFATPAFAQSGEGRVEARGGIVWAGGAEEAFIGAEAGYDFDLGETAFVGVNAGVDKVLVGGSDAIFSVGGRIGAKVGEKGKIYALGGYAFTDGSGDAAYIGAGYQHKLGSNVYGKIEYRRTLASGTDLNFAGVGVGFAF